MIYVLLLWILLTVFYLLMIQNCANTYKYYLIETNSKRLSAC